MRLEHDADLAAERRAVATRAAPGLAAARTRPTDNAARAERLQRRDRAQHGRLPGARHAHQRADLARRDVEIHAAQHRRAAARRAQTPRTVSACAVTSMLHRRSSRRANARQRQRQRQVDERAQDPGHHPAADVRRVDRRLLRELDDRDDGDERRVLEQRDEVVRHRREREAQRLRSAHEPQDLHLRQPERARRLELRARDRLERGAIDLRLVRRVVEPEPDHRREKRRQSHDARQAVVDARRAAAAPACRARPRRRP